MQTERLNIAANVKRLRVAREWSVAILAHRAGLSVCCVKRVERPDPNLGAPGTETVRRLAMALETSMAALRATPPPIRARVCALLHPELLRIRVASAGCLRRLIGFFSND